MSLFSGPRIETLCSSVTQPVTLSRAFFLSFVVFAFGVVAWTDVDASPSDNVRLWTCGWSTFAESDRAIVHQADMCVLGFSLCAFLQFALRHSLLRDTKYDAYLLASLSSLAAVVIDNAVLAADISLNLCYTTEAHPEQIRLVRPLKYVMVCLTGPAVFNLAVSLCRDLKVVTARFALIVVISRFGANVGLLAAALTGWSRASFGTCIVLSLLCNFIPSKAMGVAFSAATKSFDDKTQRIMRALPVVMLLISLPIPAMMCLGQAGVLTWVQEEVAVSVITTVAINLCLMLWSARDADAAASQVDLELKRVTMASAALDSANDAKRNFMR